MTTSRASSCCLQACHRFQLTTWPKVLTQLDTAHPDTSVLRVEHGASTRQAFNDLHVSSMPTVVVVRPGKKASVHNDIFLLSDPTAQEVADALELGRGMRLGAGALLQDPDEGLDDEWDL